MKEKIVNRLISIKSIVTLTLTFVFAYLSIVGTISGEQFLTIFTMIVSFYFGAVVEKKTNKEADQK